MKKKSTLVERQIIDLKVWATHTLDKETYWHVRSFAEKLSCAISVHRSHCFIHTSKYSSQDIDHNPQEPSPTIKSSEASWMFLHEQIPKQ